MVAGLDERRGAAQAVARLCGWIIGSGPGNQGRRDPGSLTKQAPGTKVPAVIVRGGEKKEVTLRLVRLLAR